MSTGTATEAITPTTDAASETGHDAAFAGGSFLPAGAGGEMVDAGDVGGGDDELEPVSESFPGETAEERAAYGERQRAEEIAAMPRNDRGQFTNPDKEAQAREDFERQAFEAAAQGKRIAPASQQKQTTPAPDAAAAKAKDGQAAGDKEARKAEARARWALNRVGLSDKALDAMEHDEIIAEFERVKPFLAKVDPETFGEPASNAARTTTSQAASKAAGHARDGADSRQASNAGDEDDIDTLLREIDGEEPSASQQQRQRAAQETTTQLHPAQIELAKLRVSAAEKAVKAEFESAVKSATEEQQREYMQLVAELDPKRQTLTFGSEQEIASLLRKAAWAVFGPQVSQQQHQDVLLRNRRLRAGQPSAPDGRSRQARVPQSQEEFERQAFEVVQGRAKAMTVPDGSFAR
jgi:hypothetical protein